MRPTLARVDRGYPALRSRHSLCRHSPMWRCCLRSGSPEPSKPAGARKRTRTPANTEWITRARSSNAERVVVRIPPGTKGTAAAGGIEGAPLWRRRWIAARRGASTLPGAARARAPCLTDDRTGRPHGRTNRRTAVGISTASQNEVSDRGVQRHVCQSLSRKMSHEAPFNGRSS